MKWIFAINAPSLDAYGDFARVAVVSAKQHSSLDAICLFDGEPCEFTEWLGRHNVEVIYVRSRLYSALLEISTRRDKPFWMSMGPGTFLRMEIPRLARERNWEDEWVFYTDCDVIFVSDPRPLLQPLKPRFFAGAPETFPDKPLHMNAGVMWMNVRSMENPAFDKWVDRNLERCCEWQFDQTAYRVFYNPLHRLMWRLKAPYKRSYSVLARLPRTYQWDALPNELNWKPYWGENERASVIHFQGLKPANRAELEAGKIESFTAKMGTPFFHQCANRWDKWLEEAKGA